MAKSAKNRLKKAHRAFKRMFPNSHCYKVFNNLTGEYTNWLHFGQYGTDIINKTAKA